MNLSKNILSVSNLCVSYGDMKIVRDVEFFLKQGENLGIVGESGCGKTTLLRALMRLGEGSSIQGSITFSGVDLLSLHHEKMRRLRGKDIAMIPQNALLSMDHTMSISSLFYETIKTHRVITKRQSDSQAVEMMERLLLREPEHILSLYPFELSGGMCQRVAIAVAMINHPKLILGDEPTSALDVTSQFQVVEELCTLRDQFGVSQIIVSHNLGMIGRVSDIIAVMYAGTIVEIGMAKDVIEYPLHPYTKALIQAVPDLQGNISAGLTGAPPSFLSEMQGCPFAPRCSYSLKDCYMIEQEAKEVRPNHFVRCGKAADIESWNDEVA